MTEPGRMESRAARTLHRALERLVRVHPDEVRALVWSCLYFFCLLSSYYVLRPVRDTMGLAGDVRNLRYLYLGTLGGMLLLNPLFALLVVRLPRRRFIPAVNRFFLACLVVFWLLMLTAPDATMVHVGRAFFVWVSVFNLFVVSVFWGFMADVWRTEQGKRLFGIVGVGGTAGALAGSTLTAGLVETVGIANLMLLAAALLEGACWCVRALTRDDAVKERVAVRDAGAMPARPSTATGALAGIKLTLRSPYLLGICVYMALYSITSTFLWFEQMNIVDASIEDDVARTSLFAWRDYAVNLLTIVVQIFFTGRIIATLGVGLTLAVLPIISMAGFATLGASPVLSVVIAFAVLRRASNFAVSRPAREVLYTPLGRDEKYKAKSLIDTFVYRGSDAVGAWSFDLLLTRVASLSGVAYVAVPLAAIWAVVGVALGRRQRTLAAAGEAERRGGAEAPSDP